MELSDDLKKRRFAVLWAAQRSQRYHARRSHFFDRWNKATALSGVLAGSAVVASLGEQAPSWLAGLAAFVVVVLSGVDLVAGTSEMARKHNELRRRFCELEADITRDIAPDEAKIAGWQARRLEIEADEPPTYVALDLLCHNELARSYPHLANDPPIKVGWFKAFTAHVFLWENA
jgi:hypothetical protein